MAARSFRLVYPPKEGFKDLEAVKRYLEQLVRQIELEILSKQDSVDGGTP